MHRLVERSSRMIALDDKSGYSHVFLVRNSHMYFGIQFSGWYVCYSTLRFGYKGSAYVYQTVGMQGTSYLGSLGMVTMQCIDDRMGVATEHDRHVSVNKQDTYQIDCRSMVCAFLEILSRPGHTLALNNVS